MVTAFWVEKIDARSALKTLLDVTTALHAPHLAVAEFHIDTNAGDGHYSRGNTGTPLDSLVGDPELEKVLAWLDSGPIAELKRIQIRCARPPVGGLRLVLQRQPLHDQLEVHYDANADRNGVAKVLSRIGEMYKVIPNERVSVANQAHDLAVRQDLVTQLVQSFAEASARLHQAISVGTKDLLDQTTSAADKLRAQATAEGERLRQEYDRKYTELNEVRSAFEAERRAFNDKKSTLVRRDLLEKIRGELKEHGKAFSLSSPTYRKRVPVLILFCALLAISLASLLVFGSRVLASDIPDWHILGPFAGSVLTFVTTVIFYIRWQSAWLARHADLETRNQIFNYDMLRASWFAEMMFEYKDERNQGLPQSVIEVMTKNLFEDSGKGTVAQHPADDVLAVLGKLRRVRVSDKDIELEGGRPKDK